MAATTVVFFFLCLFSSTVTADDEVFLAILHASTPGTSRDFCVSYNWQWQQIPNQLKNAPALVAVDAKPPMLCQPAANSTSLQGNAVGVRRGNCTFYLKGIHAQNAGAKEVIIVADDHLFNPGGNSSSQYDAVNIPMAVIMADDWESLMGLGETVTVQLYSPEPQLFEFNLILIFLCAVFTVVMGAYWSGVSRIYRPVVTTDQDSVHEEPPKEQEIEITPVMVVLFVIMTCASLLLMYFFYKYLVYLVIALFALASSNGLFECLYPIMTLIPFGHCKVPPNRLPLFKNQPEIRSILLFLSCVGVAIWWVIVRHASYAWILQDILGMAFCISLIKNIRINNLKVCTLLLILLLIYDVFFVFITPLFAAKESIMVKVATGDGSKEQLPMLLKIPKLTLSTMSVCDRPYSLLGFGDIIVPGLYVAYCHWFDIMRKTPRKLYLTAVSIAYGAGLIITFAALYLMKTGQPALVYLVPSTLGTGVVVSLIRKEFGQFWTGKTGIEYQQANVEAPSVNNMDDDEDDDVVLDRTQEESPSDERKSLLCR